MSRLALVALATLALSVAACGKKEPAPVTPTTTAPPASVPAPMPAPPAAAISVINVTVGNAIGADRRVTASPPTIGRNDTIYASVDTTGSGSATLKARWTYQDGQVINEESQTINPVGPATSEFHISKPDGWPAGEYQVAILVNDAPADTRKFTVQ
jgi:predicted small lipoprotein YifL